MKRLFALLIFVPILASCTTEPPEADRAACVAAGYRVETPGFAACLQELQRRRFQRRPGDTVDEMRTRLR
ncbi:MAG: hypothetical protein HKM95_05275 [Inquilinus sp.]|nr:hypothetical protein [Inquilinus sp.]